MPDQVRIEDFPLRTSNKLRYADTDRQGHVNNAVFVTLLEAGRVELIYNPAAPLAGPGSAFVIARLELDFRAEIVWPGEVDIGTCVASVGRSSFRLEQALFQDKQCVATATTVIVQMDEATRRSQPLTADAVARLSALTRSGL
ncbi:thioesterase family protein [Caenibius sp. WL]|uniref:acyl-CoA thioesterase n=1 Tax=Caenibius sp. WL TaxID=2872646 RepID=UPI001C99FFE7|nr:thioesterase family protein [Caenibius sp. WL]QZP08173.1 acyl-CoA thioesterase [Caenibius sp. WL]